MNDSFRARVIQVQTEKALSSIDPISYLVRALNSLPDDLPACIQKVGRNEGQARRFEELIHREEDVSQWARFLCHEQKREKSVWGGEVALFPDKLEEWYSSLDQTSGRDEVVQAVEKALEGLYSIGVRPLAAEDRRHIGLSAFRRAIWRLWRGGGQ
jgi:hypothetical protein